MSLSLRYAAKSHVGLLRDGNEDSGYASSRLLVVADGMGGQAAGEVASSVTVSTVATLDEDVPGGDFLDALSHAVTEANSRLRGIVDENPQLEGMGTTLTALLWTGSRLGVAHIGDSRAYRLRDGLLEQITADHTWVQRLIDEGRITQEEANHHPQRSLVMRALDGRDQIELDLSVREVRAGDRYLLCSDGLSGVVSAETLEATLAGYADLDQVTDVLIQLALRGGGPDNVTCIVADVVEGPDIGPEVPMMVGAAAEGLAGGSPRPHGVSAQRGDDEIPHTPAGRAARLRGPADQQPYMAAKEPGDEEQDRPRHKWRRPVAFAAIAIVVLAALAYGGYYYSQQQYYVGETTDGHVAIYRGLSQEVAGVHLSQVYERQSLRASQLPPYERAQLASTISADNLHDARGIVLRLSQSAAECAAWRASLTSPSPSSSPTPSNQLSPGHSSSPAGKPGTTTTHTHSTNPTPSSSATPTGHATPGASPTTTPNPATNDLAATCGDAGGGQ